MSVMQDTIYGHESAACGLVADAASGKDYVAIAGGVFTDMVELMDLETLTWAEGEYQRIISMTFINTVDVGPRLPYPMYSCAFVKYNGTLHVFGGYNEYNEILRLNLEEYEWEVLEGENLQMQRGSAAAFIVNASAFPEC